jgi:hypothetical protein
MERAKILQERWDSPRKVLVDDLSGTVHQQYAMVPNQNWVIDHAGLVCFKGAWTTRPTSVRGLRLRLRYEI